MNERRDQKNEIRKLRTERRPRHDVFQFSVFASLISLLCVLPLFAADGPAALQAQELWKQREKPEKMQRAIALWKNAWAQNPDHPDLLISLTMACNAAYRHSDVSREKDRWADQALAYGEQAVAKNPDRPEAHAYYAEALGQYAQAHKGFSGLKKVKRAVAELNKAVSLNPKDAYAHMLLAEFYRSAPSSISVGDKKKALAEARLAVQDGPGVAINHLTLAQALLANGLKTEAERELKLILSLTPPPDQIPETHSDQDTAKALLKKLGDH